MLFELKAPDNILNVHQAALELLAEKGIYIDHPAAIDLLVQHRVPVKDNRAYLPSKLVAEVLATVASRSGRFELYDRTGHVALTLGNGETYFGPGSDALDQIDPATGELVPTTMEHIANNVKLADALPGYNFVMSMGVPNATIGMSPERVYPEVFATMVKNTTKPLVATLTSLADLERMHQIAAIAAGGTETLRRRPFFIAYLEPLSPLIIDTEGAARILYAAEAGIPIVFAAGANLGITAPIYVQWGVLQGHAESLAGMTLAGLKNPDVKFVYGANTSSMDMRTMKVGYGSPEWFKSVALYAMLGDALGLPAWGTAGCSDSFKPDVQAGAEAMEGIILALLSKSTLVHDMGYLAYGQLNNPAMHVLVNILIDRARELLAVPDFSAENLAHGRAVLADVIAEKRNFFDHDTTLDDYRQALWIPPAQWERRDLDLFPGRDLAAELLAEAGTLMARPQPQPLRPDQLTAIDRVLDEI